MSQRPTDLDAPHAPRSRILAVDDEPLNLRLLHSALGADHEMLMASNGDEAIQVCVRELPDLVLLDIVMPGIDGLEVCRRLKADSDLRHIPVIFITGKTAPEEETEALSSGAVDFIIKPINPAVVRARVQTHLRLKAQSDLLRQQVFVDGLTGVSNRRRFDEMLDLHWRSCARLGHGLSVFMIDVDYFKAYNDHFGHQAGDDCLRHIAQSLGSVLRRSGDVVARYGGEEFVCLSTSLLDDAAVQAAEVLRSNVECLAIPHPLSGIADVVTISIGVASEAAATIATPEALLSLVDSRLYQAKAGGRNRVVAG